MAQLLATRLGAIRICLDSSPPERRVSLSRAQSAAMVEMVKRHEMELNGEQRAELTLRVAQINWNNNDDMNLLNALNPSNSGSKVVLQDYVMFHHFLFSALWKQLLDMELVADVKLTMLCNHLIRLGLRHPKEHTSKLMTSLWMLVSFPNAVRFSFSQKQSWHARVKKEFLELATQAPAPSSNLMKLPGTPAELLKDYPALYRGAFAEGGDAAPTACPIDMLALREMDASFRCRGSGGDTKQNAASKDFSCGTLSRSGTTTRFDDGSSLGYKLEDFGSMIGQQLQQMQQMQCMAMRALAGGVVQGGAQGSSPNESAGLLDGLIINGDRRGAPRGSIIAEEKAIVPSDVGVGSFLRSVSNPFAQRSPFTTSMSAEQKSPTSSDSKQTEVTPPRGVRDDKLKEHVADLFSNLKFQKGKGPKKGKKEKEEKEKEEEETEEEETEEEEEEEEEEEDDDTPATPPTMKAMKGCVGGKSGKKIKKKKKSKGDKGKVDSPPAMKAMKKSVPAKDEKKTHKKKDGKKTHKKKDKKTKGGKGTAPEWGDLLLWPAGGPVSNGAFTSAAYDKTKRRALLLGNSKELSGEYAKRAYADATVICTQKMKKMRK